MLDDVIAGVTHDDHVADGVANAGQLTGNGGAKFSDNFGGSAALALKRQTQLAHYVGALEGNFAGDRFGHLSLEALCNVGWKPSL
jgi:hypothetical protein